jgi:hypothetical protein
VVSFGLICTSPPSSQHDPTNSHSLQARSPAPSNNNNKRASSTKQQQQKSEELKAADSTIATEPLQKEQEQVKRAMAERQLQMMQQHQQRSNTPDEPAVGSYEPATITAPSPFDKPSSSSHASICQKANSL